METSLISDFAILSIVMGLLIGLGTMSMIRGLFTFLIFMGLTLAQVLGVVGVNEILSYFLGLAIIMGSTCLLLRAARPETIVKVMQELKFRSGKCH
jgi:hypothetical protein